MPTPGAPTGLSATALGRVEIRLNWADGVNTEGQLILAGPVNDPAQASLVGAVDGGVQLFKHAGLPSGSQRFYWLQPISTDELGAVTGSATATTAGAQGAPGDNLIGMIISAAKGRLLNVLPADWKEAAFIRQPERNSKMGRDQAWGVMPGSGDPGEAAVFGSYTQDLEVIVGLFKGADGGQGETAVAAAEGDLYTWADRVVRDFKKNRFFIPSIVLRVADPTFEKPEYIAEAEGVLLKMTFRVMYRNKIS